MHAVWHCSGPDQDALHTACTLLVCTLTEPRVHAQGASQRQVKALVSRSTLPAVGCGTRKKGVPAHASFSAPMSTKTPWTSIILQIGPL